MNLDDARVSKDLLNSVVDNIKYNKVIIDYYNKISSENIPNINSDTLKNVSERIYSCNKYWQLDKYQVNKVKDFKKTNLCRDKFCANCKKVKQASRMAKYIPFLSEYKDKLYHLTLTVPNCKGSDLSFTYKMMAKAFKSLINYLNGYKRIKGLEFDSWGYEGAIRSLECTFKGDSYHPHFHVCLILNKDLSNKQFINKYSYDFKGSSPVLTRYFSSEEILIQKIWYLLINGSKVNLKNINDLDIGYSCIVDKFKDDDFAELFKYMTKEKDENGEVLTYENFKTLYISFYRVKQIQGYGSLYSVTDDLDIESLLMQYNAYIDELRKKESPEIVYQTPQDLLCDNEYTLISRKNYFKYLNKI